MDTLKVVIIGCGARGNDHAEGYDRIAGVTLVGCFDPDSGRCKALADKYSMRAFDDAEKMLDEVKPDIVSITTYPGVRLKLMRLVSRAEVPACLVEKPLATGAADWKELCALEAESETRFAVSHQVRWHKDLSRCGEAVNSGRLGKVLFLDLSAGMNISGQGTHTLNYGMLLNGDSPVKRVFGAANGWDTDDPKHPAPDMTEAMLTFENGVRAMWTSGPVSPLAGDPEFNWQHVRVAAYCEKGWVKYEEFADWCIVEGENKEEGSYGGMDVWKSNNCDSQMRLQQAMVDWLHDPAKIPGTNLKQSLHEWAVVLALYQSAIERRPVEMKDFSPSDDLIDRYMQTIESES